MFYDEHEYNTSICGIYDLLVIPTQDMYGLCS